MKAVERWGSSDQFALLQQLGTEPQTEEAQAGEGQAAEEADGQDQGHPGRPVGADEIERNLL